MDRIRKIADAVLYEGYVLWPYRRSALKNQQRWTFGGVYPEAYSAQRGGDDPSLMRTECLLEAAPDAELEVSVRFLHVVARQVVRHGRDGPEPVDELMVGDERHVSWDEACERELDSGPMPLGALAEEPRRIAIDIPSAERREPLAGGELVRSWLALAGSILVGATELLPSLYRVSVRIDNATPWAGQSREETLRRTFCSTHTVLRCADGAFASLTDPPESLRDAAGGCSNAGTWPVLVGEEGQRDTLLSSPIILPDYPQVAPESPGDLFDGGEIDQLLTLSILAMTEEEKREMRAADPRTREILERTEALSDEELMRLHGAVREFGLARRP